MQRDDRALTRGWHHSRRLSRSHTLCHMLAHANLLLLNRKIQLLFSSLHFDLTYKYKIVFKLLGFSVEQILNSGVLIGKKNVEFNPLLPALIYGFGGSSKLLPIPWPQRRTGLLLVSHHPSAGAEAEDDTDGRGGPLLHSYVSCQTHLWNLPPPLCIFQHNFWACSGLILKCIFLFFDPYFQRKALQ